MDMVLGKAMEDLKQILEGKTLDYRRQTGNFVLAIIPRIASAGLVALKPEVKETLKEVGEMFGRRVIAEVIEAEDLESSLKGISKLLEGSRYGRGEVVKVSKNAAVYRVYECADCGGMPDVGRSLCGFDEGIIKGVLEKKLGKPVKVDEVECWGSGYKHCEFDILIYI